MTKSSDWTSKYQNFGGHGSRFISPGALSSNDYKFQKNHKLFSQPIEITSRARDVETGSSRGQITLNI